MDEIGARNFCHRRRRQGSSRRVVGRKRSGTRKPAGWMRITDCHRPEVCKPCPEGTFSSAEGAFSNQTCSSTLGRGASQVAKSMSQTFVVRFIRASACRAVRAPVQESQFAENVQIPDCVLLLCFESMLQGLELSSGAAGGPVLLKS